MARGKVVTRKSPSKGVKSIRPSRLTRRKATTTKRRNLEVSNGKEEIYH